MKGLVVLNFLLLHQNLAALVTLDVVAPSVKIVTMVSKLLLGTEVQITNTAVEFLFSPEMVRHHMNPDTRSRFATFLAQVAVKLLFHRWMRIFAVGCKAELG